MKLFSILLLSLFLTGCAAFNPQPRQAILQDQQNFCLAFEEFQSSHRIDSLQKLKVDYPDSVWAVRAETIILYVQELSQRKVQIEKLRKSEQRQMLEFKQLKKKNQQMSEKINQLQKLNLELTQMIEQLKSSLIQSEKHTK